MNTIAIAASTTSSNLVAILDQTVALVANKGELFDEWAEDCAGMYPYSFCDKSYIVRSHPRGYTQIIVVSVTNHPILNKIAPVQINVTVVGQITQMCTLTREERLQVVGTDPATVAAAVPALIKEIESRFAPAPKPRRRH